MMGDNMDNTLQTISEKAEILIDALPYIRDFNQKIIVLEYVIIILCLSRKN